MGRRKIRAEEVSGFLDHGTTVTGELRFSGTLRIEGEFHGSITSEDTLTIGQHAEVHADIRAGEVEIHGRVTGTVEAARRIELRSTAKVRGDVRAPVLVINEGASLDGESRMTGSDAEGTTVDAKPYEGVDEAN